MKIEKIIKTKEEIEGMGYKIENNIIESIDVRTIGHFNNITTLRLCLSNCTLLSDNNMTGILHLMIKNIIELFDLTDDDGIELSKIKKVPCRIGQKDFKVKVIGNFMSDKFLVVQDLIDFSVEEAKEQYRKQFENE